MKKEPYYLKYYELWMETGKMEWVPGSGYNGGLCGSPVNGEHLKLFSAEGGASNFWGYGRQQNRADYYTILRSFTPLRQTILLLMAAINEEL